MSHNVLSLSFSWLIIIFWDSGNNSGYNNTTAQLSHLCHEPLHTLAFTDNQHHRPSETVINHVFRINLDPSMLNQAILRNKLPLGRSNRLLPRRPPQQKHLHLRHHSRRPLLHPLQLTRPSSRRRGRPNPCHHQRNRKSY